MIGPQQGRREAMMWWFSYSGMGWMMVLSILLWALLIGVAVWALVRWMQRQPPSGEVRRRISGGDALSSAEILRQRFARGEVDAATFQAMRAELEARSTMDPMSDTRQPVPAEKCTG
jgi:uncharacterized membrane protein